MGDERDEVGAVELYYPGIGWTGICADPDRAHYWLQDDQAAQVVCRQLGYHEGRTYIKKYVPHNTDTRFHDCGFYIIQFGQIIHCQSECDY